jgi:hypothetical protein
MSRPADHVDHLSETLERDGFVVVPDFFDPALVTQARNEIDSWYQRDLEERKRCSAEVLHDGVAGKSVLTAPTHLMLDVYAKSPTLDALFEKILTDPASSRLLEKLAGKNIKLRGYNIKRMTKNRDPKPSLGPTPLPHEWHIDSPNEICITIPLDDFSQPGNGTTALMKGSHMFPYCPRWNCLFGPIAPVHTSRGLHSGIKLFMRLTLFSRLLARRLRSRETGAHSKRGDFYIFINDTWHGREPNVHDHDYMMLMVGAFPTESAFPDAVKPPNAQTLAALPQRLRASAAQSLPANAGGDSILARVRARRLKALFPSLFWFARMERAIADRCTRAYFSVAIPIIDACRPLRSHAVRVRNLALRILAKLKRTFKGAEHGGA